MAYKRPRSAFEADLQANGAPFVTYGTPLPPLDSDLRDDGSYVPVWKQEVTDERGRKRLHGAFTGGFSAGYFNTVGSKEGWAPSTFVSSRTNRQKKETKQQQKPEDFMDDEDLAEQAEAQILQTNDSFAGIGSTEADSKRKATVMDLFRNEGETMGVKLLRRMGWRDGQGVGPRVRRKARLADHDLEAEDAEEHLFAPENSKMIVFVRKNDRKGLGYEGDLGLQQVEEEKNKPSVDDDEDDHRPSVVKAGSKTRKGGFGMGVLNDTGSDDEDPYAMGPRISYNKVIGGDKKKKAKAAKLKTPNPSANPLLNSRPLFTSKKAAPSGFRKCFDGHLPLDGFLLSIPLEALSMDDSDRFPRPGVPKDWKSSKAASAAAAANATYISTADAAKLSHLDPKARAAILGEAQLPGKSVFDFLSPAARDRIVSATGKGNLPAAGGESIPLPPTNQSRRLDDDIPILDTDIAVAALGRGVGGWMPYADDLPKRNRYRAFLEYQAGIREKLPDRPLDLKQDTWMHELREFAHAARVFRPVTGLMASRFQSSSAAPQMSTNDEVPVLMQPQPRQKDPAEEAAKLGLFGQLTRTVLTFYPTRLLCKRFNVKVPDHVTTATEGRAAHGVDVDVANEPEEKLSGSDDAATALLGIKTFIKGPVEQDGKDISRADVDVRRVIQEAPSVDMERNEALEGNRAGDDLFKAIFGDDDSD